MPTLFARKTVGVNQPVDVAVKRVRATSTTATGIHALYTPRS
jgi:hypothetical protein